MLFDRFDDIIDSRTVIERVRELEDERESYRVDDRGMGDGAVSWDDTDEASELELLEELNKDGEETFGSEWKHGVTLIRFSHFAEYARELAEDIGATSGEEKWPLNHIDWDAAANELRYDYASVYFDGIEYLGFGG